MKNIFVLFIVLIIVSFSACTQEKIINGSLGVITKSDQLKYGDSIEFFNPLNNKKSGVFIYNEEYEMINFFCLKDNSTFYLVKDAEENEFLIQKTSKVQLIDWNEFVLSSFSVIPIRPDFNLLYSSPYIESKVINYDKDEFYHPVQIKGDWLQVKWGDQTSKYQYAWLKWKENGKLIIEIFHFA